MWRQTLMWRRLRNDGNVISNNVASKCGVAGKCGGSPKCGVKQCGVKMWRQAQMWRQSEMWCQTMWRQNVASETHFTKLSSRKFVFKKGIQWQAQKCYTKCLWPIILYNYHSQQCSCVHCHVSAPKRHSPKNKLATLRLRHDGALSSKCHLFGILCRYVAFYCFDRLSGKAPAADGDGFLESHLERR